jgi:flavin-dependent dehydrogenase
VSPTPVDVDVVVVGGGPAGSSSAAMLARLGRSVLLLERDEFPRFHIGESLLACMNQAMEAIGAQDKIRDMRFVQKWGATFGTGDGKHEQWAAFGAPAGVPQPQTWQVERAVFDKFLLDHAISLGADVRYNHRVLDTEFDRDGVTVTFNDNTGTQQTVRAKAVIDASGRWGLLARKFDLRVVEPRLANIGIFSHYSGVPRKEGKRAGDAIIIARDDLGWFWMIPIAEELMSVGVVLRREVYDTWPRMTPEEALDKAIAETPVMANVWMKNAKREWPVRVEKDFSYATKAYAGDRWLLAGDAGSFLDPVFSTGVSIALESGVEAGRALHAALEAGDLSAAQFKRFSARQRARYVAFRRFVVGFYGRHFRDVFFQPDPPKPFFDAVVRLLAGHWRPSLSHRMVLEGFYGTVWLHEKLNFVDPIPGVGTAPRV